MCKRIILKCEVITEEKVIKYHSRLYTLYKIKHTKNSEDSLYKINNFKVY